MAYTKQTWDDDNPLFPTNEARMSYLEDGIEDAHDAVVADTLTYRTVLVSNGVTGVDAISGHYFLRQGSTSWYLSGASLQAGIQGLHLDPADYPSTAKLRVRGVVGQNTVASGINFSFGLTSVTIAGGNDVVTITAGTPIAAASITAATPATSTFTVVTGADFAVPVAGFYVPYVFTSGTLANNSYAHLTHILQMRHSAP